MPFCICIVAEGGYITLIFEHPILKFLVRDSNILRFKEGSVAEWSACRIRNPAVLSLSSALTTFQILSHTSWDC